MTSPLPSKTEGFTLVELLIAAFIAVITANVAGDLLLSHMRSSEHAEFLERQRSDWARTNGFLEAEIALSERAFSYAGGNTSAALPIAVPSSCDVKQSEVRLQLDLRRDLPPVIYAVRPSTSGWVGDNTLWRCGPSLNPVDGSYCSLDQINDNQDPCYNQPFISASRILDGLDSGADGGGFSSESQDGKLISFILSLKGHKSTDKSGSARYSPTFKQNNAVLARINPLFSIPSENSLCESSNLVKLEGSPSLADTLVMGIGQVRIGEDVLICGRGISDSSDSAQGDSITGSDGANDILEAGDLGKSYLKGLSGNDVLRGTTKADVLEGGDGDDILIGREGSDTMIGGSGQNSYLPGSGNNTIQGGNGLDIIFFQGNKSEYTIGSSCSKASCSVQGPNNSSTTITNGEILIFKNARVDLPD